MSNRSAIFSKKFPGLPVNIVDIAQFPGNVFFVDSGNTSQGGNTTGHGLSPDSPFLTIDYAVGRCTAGDVIIVMPGHAESIAAATGCVCDIAGISIIGLGHGSLIPTITLGTLTTALISVTAANVKIKNIKVISDLENLAVGIDVGADADGFVLEDCWLLDGGLTKELVIGVQIAAACDNVLIKNNRFQTTVSAGTGGCASAIKLAGATSNSRIIHNFIHGNYSAAAIDGATAAGISIYIEDNHILQIDTDAALAISLNAGTTGIVVRNLICNLLDTAVPVVAAACCVAENYGSNAVGASGIIKPAVDI